MKTFISLPKIVTSPTMQVSSSPFPTRLPKQLRRALPLYIVATLVFFFFLSRQNSMPSSPIVAGALKRVWSPQSHSSSASREFTKKIWQTWKVDPHAFEGRERERAKSWPALNPGYRYEVLTDGNDMNYVELHFGPLGFNRPDIVSTYRLLTAQIIKADLLRYLVMYVEGGVYADIDVEAIKPVDQFIPINRYNPKDVDLVVSVEIDEPDFNDHPILGPKSQSFCQWTFMAKPRVPVMLKLVDGIVKWLDGVAKKQMVPISEIVLDFDEVLTGTGPSAFTKAIMAEMSQNSGHKMDWSYFHNITEPRLIGGVLVLTVRGFAAGQGHSNSGNHDHPDAMVRHHYHASGWPKKHPRFFHPVYREVELCNWNKTCVEEWDKNTAAFKNIPKEEQEVMIVNAKAIYDKEVADKLEMDRIEQEKIKQDERERQMKELGACPCPPPEPVIGDALLEASLASLEPAVDMPVEAGKSIEGAKPTEGAKPIEGAKSVEGDKLEGKKLDEKTAEVVKPVEDDKPVKETVHVDGNS